MIYAEPHAQLQVHNVVLCVKLYSPSRRLFKLIFACQNHLFTGDMRGTESAEIDERSNAVNDGCDSEEKECKPH